jgi:hypothetical protein
MLTTFGTLSRKTTKINCLAPSLGRSSHTLPSGPAVPPVGSAPCSLVPPFNNLFLFPGIYRLHSASGYSSSEYLTRALTRLTSLLPSLRSQVKRVLGIRRDCTIAHYKSSLLTTVGYSRSAAHPCAASPPFGPSALRPSWPRAPGPSFRAELALLRH